MGRIRTIKPEFFMHDGLYDAEAETGLPSRLAFIGLWTCCDWEGRFEWRPRILKAQIMPYDDVPFDDILGALERHGFIVRYEVEGADLGYVPSFHKHQRPNMREAKSDLPEPPSRNARARTCTHVQDDEAHVHAHAAHDNARAASDGKNVKSLKTNAHVHAREIHVQDTATHMHARGEGKGREREGEGEGKGNIKEEEEVARAHAHAHTREAENLHARVLEAVGLKPGRLPTYWKPPGAIAHVLRWRDDLGLTEDEIVDIATYSRASQPEPPDGPKALDGVMRANAAALRGPPIVPGSRQARPVSALPTPRVRASLPEGFK